MLLYLGRFYSVLSCCSSMLPPPWPPLLFPYTTLFRSAYAAAMKADLRIAALYEEQFAADNHGQYFGGVATADNPLNGYRDRKSTRLNSSHLGISYAVLCVKKKRTRAKQHATLSKTRVS